MEDVTKTLEKVESGVKRLDDFMSGVEKRLTAIEQQKANAVAAGGIVNPMNPQGYTTNIFTPNANSDEKMALSYFRCGSVKKLLTEVNVCAPIFKHVPQHLKEMVLQLKADLDISRMMMQWLHGEPLDKWIEINNQEINKSRVKGVLDGNWYGKEVLAPKLKQFSTSADAEWIPTGVAARYFEEFELERIVMAQFKTEPMPTNPYDLPTQDGTTKARIQAENGTIADVTFPTGKITMDATKLTEFHALSTEVDEDTAPNILAAARDNVMQAQERAEEDSVINGDDTATMDSDIGGAEDNRRAWKGLRKLAIDNSANGATVDFSAAAITLAKLREMRTALGKFGVKVADLRLFVSPKTVNQVLAIPEVTTVDKYGPSATVVTGEIGKIDGYPIITTEYQRDDVNASGVYDGVTVNLSTIQMVNRSRFFKGQRRPIRSKVVMHPVPPNDQWLMASWQRADWKGFTQDAGEVSVVNGINIA